MRDFFISYASEDRPAAEQLVDSLEGLGATCFIDVRDISPGHPNYREVLVHGIANCECIVVVLSDCAQASDEVFREVQVAHDRGRRRMAIWLNERKRYTNPTLEMLLTSTQDVVWGNRPSSEVAQRILATSTVSALRRQLADYQSVVDQLQVDLSQIFAAFDAGELTDVVMDVHRSAVSILRRLWREYGIKEEPPGDLGGLLRGCRDHFEHQSLITNFAAIADVVRIVELRRRPTMDQSARATENLMAILSVLRAHRWGLHELSPSLRRDAAFLSGLLVEVGWLQGSEMVPRSDLVYLLFEKTGRDTTRYLEIVLGEFESAMSEIVDESSGQIIPVAPSVVTTRFLVLARPLMSERESNLLSTNEFVAKFTGLKPMASLSSRDRNAGADRITNAMVGGATNVLYYGPPGTGKSTALRYLAERGWPGAPEFRFFVDYAQSDRRDLSTALEAQLSRRFADDVRPRVREIVSYLVRTGRAALILDSIECATEVDQPSAVARTFARLCAFLSTTSNVVMAGRDAALCDSPTVREFLVGEPAVSDALSQTLRSTGVDSATLPALRLVRARGRPRWVASTARDRLIQVLSEGVWDAREDRAAQSLAAAMDLRSVLAAATPLPRSQIVNLAVGAVVEGSEVPEVGGSALSKVGEVRVLRELRAALDYVRTCTGQGDDRAWDGVSVGETTRRLVRLMSRLLSSDLIPQAPGLAMVGPPNCVLSVATPTDLTVAARVVTVGEYREFLSALATMSSLGELSPGLPDEGRLYPMYERLPRNFYRDEAMSDHPAVGVSWWAADSYARWLGTRLPTSLEWEVAGRGWDGRIFPWGDAPEISALNCADRAAGKPIVDYAVWRAAMRSGDVAPRNARSVLEAHALNISPTGQRDMAGNVWEWVSTDLGVHRVIAGGAYDNPLRACVLSSRSVAAPDTRSNAVGFRVMAP